MPIAREEAPINFAGLSPQQRRIAYLLCEKALSYKEVAYKLHIGTRTVNTYMSQIYDVLGVHTQLELMLLYWQGRMLERHISTINP